MLSYNLLIYKMKLPFRRTYLIPYASYYISKGKLFSPSRRSSIKIVQGYPKKRWSIVD